MVPSNPGRTSNDNIALFLGIETRHVCTHEHGFSSPDQPRLLTLTNHAITYSIFHSTRVFSSTQHHRCSVSANPDAESPTAWQDMTPIQGCSHVRADWKANACKHVHARQLSGTFMGPNRVHSALSFAGCVFCKKLQSTMYCNNCKVNAASRLASLCNNF